MKQLGLCLLMALVLNACYSKPTPPMRIGTDTRLGSAPLHLASALGLLDEKVFRLVDFSTTSESIRSFRNGALEAACLTLDEVLRAQRDGLDPVVLLVLDESRGGDALLARGDIKAMDQLKGKRVGIEVGSEGSFLLARALKAARMAQTDLTLVYLPADKHMESFANFEVDAVVTYEPARTKILERDAVNLFDSSMVPGEIVSVLVVRGDYVRKHQNVASLLRTAWFSALDHLQKEPNGAISLMARRLQITVGQFQSGLDAIHIPGVAEAHARLGGPNPTLKESAISLMAVMREAGLLTGNVDIDPLFSMPPK
jgi:NitT/TauT family transport system substrate-binding protein